MKKTFTLIAFIFLCAYGFGQNFAVGVRTENYIDVTRNSRQVSTTVYYPADVAGNNVVVAAGNSKFPVVVFGHGFVISPSSYKWLADSLVPRGYIVAFPSTEGGISPSHTNFANDLKFLCGYITSLNDAPSSFLYGRVIKKSAVAGHSMGGGCSFLAAAGNTSINAIFNFAAAETNPSAIAAAKSITVPSLIFSGSSDCIAPDNSQQSMYANIAASCKTYIDIVNALHCQFANNNGTCVLGQALSGCNSSPLSPAVVFNKVTALLIPFLDFYLKDNCSGGDNFIATYGTLTGITKMQSCTDIPSCGPLPVTLQKFSGKYNNNQVILDWNITQTGSLKNFIVERSTDANSFSELTIIAASGNSANSTYSSTDAHPYPGTCYYRLKIMDVDGRYKYSAIVNITTPVKELSLTRLFPNPAAEEINLELYASKKQPVSINIFGATGEKIVVKNISVIPGINNATMQLGKLASGFYMLQVRNQQDNILMTEGIIKK